jgi:hypothetical protein
MQRQDQHGEDCLHVPIEICKVKSPKLRPERATSRPAWDGKMRNLWIGVIFAIGSTPAFAGNSASVVGNGHNLKMDCAEVVRYANQGFGSTLEADGLSLGYCLGQIRALLVVLSVSSLQMYRGTNKPKIEACLPERTTSGDAVRVVMRYLERHPDELREPGSLLALYALSEAYPCE